MTSPRPTRISAGVIAGVLSLSAAATFAADSPWLYGIHWFGPTAMNASDVNAMTGNKAVWTVETVMTNDGAGQWGPEGQLANLRNVAALGHTIIMRVQPVWGKAFPLPGDTSPSMSGFLDQVTHTATLYKDICHIWFLGNEMNLLIEWGNQPLSPEAYIDAAAQFSDRIKTVAGSLGPQIVLVGPAAVGINVSGAMHMVNTEYISRMCDRINAMNYRDKFDGFALHAYAQFEPAMSDDLATNLRYFETEPGYGYQHQIGIIDSKGFAGYPIYITEWNRYTGSSPGESASAAFLHNAFTRLNAWNQSHHPVVCACWYVYAEDAAWEGFSLRNLKSSGSADQDVWHAFQYAAGFNYPAGAFRTPVIALSTSGWSRSMFAGTDLSSDTFSISNAGPGTLTYTVSDNADWLSCSPVLGTSAGEADAITVDYSVGGLTAGLHQAAITVSDPAATPPSRTITVDLRVSPVPGDFDGDRDVDQQDFGRFQACYSGPGVPQNEPLCGDADFDGDRDVDQSDFTVLRACLTGPAVLANADCANPSP